LSGAILEVIRVRELDRNVNAGFGQTAEARLEIGGVLSVCCRASDACGKLTWALAGIDRQRPTVQRAKYDAIVGASVKK